MVESLDVQAKRIFERVLDAAEPERERMLDSLCADDPDLAARVRSLLNAASKDDRFLRDPTLPTPRVPSPHDAEWRMARPDSDGLASDGRIGPYRLVEQIGEGGFGVVYRAEQEAPVRRFVAVKVVKLGMDTRAVVARFEQERQALAVMDHPGIAKVFDAGATPTGRPYFAMELVAGEPITTYCDRVRLDIPSRLALFIQVCRAVQHAHTKGIIHRDLKPGNVLVFEQDEKHCIKVIDFGIAKATQQTVTDKTVFTEYRQLVGTPEYMSPEQACGSLDIDTRSDVYALGVMLYEMLTGVPPIDPARLRSATYAEMQRMIREDDPPPPSTRLLHSRDTLAHLAAMRRIEPRRLSSFLRGELDWIVLRAIDKDRSRRYDSAGLLADDVARFLALEPVQAAPPNTVYRIRKFVRRHRAPVIGGIAVATALLLGLGTALWQAGVARRERDAAREAARAAEAATLEAERRRVETDLVARFQASQLRGMEPARMGLQLKEILLASASQGLSRINTDPEVVAARRRQLESLLHDANLTDVAVRTLDVGLFARSLDAIHAQFKDQPLVRAQLLATLARTMLDLGLGAGAEEPMSEALAILRAELGSDDAETIEATLTLAHLRRVNGDLTSAESLSRAALERARTALGNDHETTVNAVNNLAVLLYHKFQLGEANELAREALSRRMRLSGPDHINTIRALSNVGLILSAQGRMPEVEPFWRETLERFRRVQGPDHHDTLQAMANLASLLMRLGRNDESEPLVHETLEKMRHLFGEDHPSTLRAMELTGVLWKHQGRFADAEQLQRKVLERRRTLLGPKHQSTLESLGELTGLLMTLGRVDEAEPLAREELSEIESKYGAASIPAAISRLQFARCLYELGRFQESEAAILETQRLLNQAALPPDHQVGHDELYRLYLKWDQAEPVRGYREKAEAIRARLRPLDSTSP